MSPTSAQPDQVLQAILPHIPNALVLDVGCVGHSLDNRNVLRRWVHEFLCEHAAHVVGIDLLANEISQLRQEGYDVRCADAESFELTERFDVIVAGELIEHLSNPGLFLRQCNKHLVDRGLLILTTPNAFSLHHLLAVLCRRTNDPYANPEHTFLFSPRVLRVLVGRYGLQIEHLTYADFPFLKPKLKHRLVSAATSLGSRRFKTTMIAICRKIDT